MSNGAGQTRIDEGTPEAELRQAKQMEKQAEEAPETTKIPKEVFEVEEEEEDVFEEALDENLEVNITQVPTVPLGPQGHSDSKNVDFNASIVYDRCQK